jgi:hypothetical protein
MSLTLYPKPEEYHLTICIIMHIINYVGNICDR